MRPECFREARRGRGRAAALRSAVDAEDLADGFSVNVRTTCKLEQRIREDLGFRYLAGGATPDHKTLSEFHRRHRDAITAMFTEALLFLRRAGMARLGTVAIDSTRVKASASPDRLLRRDAIERELRKKVKSWQQELDDDPDRDPGTRVGREQITQLREQLKHLRESGEEKLLTTDPDARFLRERGRFVLGYTAEVAVSEDHFIVAQRVTQNKNDNHALIPMVDEVERQCGERPQRVLADCGFFSMVKICGRWKIATSKFTCPTRIWQAS